jgi:hypothetical protein
MDALVAARPEPGLLGHLHAAGCQPFLTADELKAVGFQFRLLTYGQLIDRAVTESPPRPG